MAWVPPAPTTSAAQAPAAAASAIACAALSGRRVRIEPKITRERDCLDISGGRADHRRVVGAERKPVDRGAARIAEPEQAGALVERLPGGVVERRAEDAERPSLGYVDQHRVPAAREQADEGRLRRLRLQVERGDMPPEVVDRDQRQL